MSEIYEQSNIFAIIVDLFVRDNGVAPASEYANNAHGGAAAEALNNLAAATAADRQSAANQAEAVANLAGANQQLAHQLQQAQQQIQKMMENLHLPGTAPVRSYQPPPQKPAPATAHIPATPAPARLNQGDPNRVRETNRPAHFGAGTMKITVTPAASMLQNGTPAKPVPHPAAALNITSKPPEPTSWEDWRNTARWSASDGAGVRYIH